MIEHNLFEMENYRELIDEVGLRNCRRQRWNLLKWQDFLRQLTAMKEF